MFGRATITFGIGPHSSLGCWTVDKGRAAAAVTAEAAVLRLE